jgi:hypothetical protein
MQTKRFSFYVRGDAANGPTVATIRALRNGGGRKTYMFHRGSSAGGQTYFADGCLLVLFLGGVIVFAPGDLGVVDALGVLGLFNDWNWQGLMSTDEMDFPLLLVRDLSWGLAVPLLLRAPGG